MGGTTGCLGCTLCQKRLKLSSTVNECKPLLVGQEDQAVGHGDGAGDHHAYVRQDRVRGRGLHPSTFQLNMSRF